MVDKPEVVQKRASGKLAEISADGCTASDCECELTRMHRCGKRQLFTLLGESDPKRWLEPRLWSQRSSMIHVGAWSLAFSCPRAHRSTPPSTSRTDKFGESRKCRVACLCPSATVQICNPRMSRAARPDVASTWHQSNLEPANARRPVGSRAGSTRCYPTTESDRCPAVSARHCSHRPAPRVRRSP